MAKSVSIDGKTTDIDRSRRSRSGKVVDTREVTLRGKKHRLAIIESQKSKDQKLAVDLGPAKKLDVTIEKGDEIQVKGVPVKSKDRIILMAQSVTHDGKQFQIARAKSKKSASMAKTEQKDETQKR